MKLLNFSVGKVQTIQIGDEAIQTAHLKAPINEPWLINEDGAKGDERAVHPDKLYAFAHTGYQYWREYLGVDPESWQDGFFGENLTLDILDENDIRVGDVFAIGENVRLVVTGARTPCVKLAWRLNQPRTFQKVFAKSRHSGVYLGVLQTGQIQPGDVLQRIKHDPTMPSIADVCDFVADHTPPPLDPLKRLLACEHLSLVNRMFLSAKLEIAERAEITKEGGWLGWRPFKIKEIVEEAQDIRSFKLEPVDNKLLRQPHPGQYVSVQMQGINNKKIVRAWSLSNFAYTMQNYRLTIRKQSGLGSNWMHQAKAGTEIMLRAPTGSFVLDMGSFRPVVLIAAGIGITPLLAMLHAHLSRKNTPPVYLIYGAKKATTMAFKSELDLLAKKHAQLKITYVYSQSTTNKRSASRITLQVLKEALSDLHVMLDKGHKVNVPWYEGDTYICGPDGFCQNLKTEIVKQGGNSDHVYIETFTTVNMEISHVEFSEVKFSQSGITRIWKADREQTLLELAEEAGIAISNDCRIGTCLTCKVPISEGETTAVTDDGHTLLCIGHPKTKTLILDC